MAASRCRQLIGALVVVAAVVALGECKSVKTKPASEYFTLCRRSDPKINDCIKQNIITLRPRLITGIPELRLIPLDPLVIPEMSFREGDGNFKFVQTMKNITITGLGNFTITSIDFKFDATMASMKMVMTVPTMRMTGDYEMEGKVLVLPIKGAGDCWFDFNDLRTTAHTTAHVVTRGGEEYLDVDDVKWDISVGKAKFQLNNLFNGDKTLGEGTNRFLNENWEEAFLTYKHLPEDGFGQVFRELTNQVFKRYTIKELFLE